MKPSDRIDDAIDQVAARMTRVDGDAELANRIIASLPERSGWTLSWLMPRLAMTAVLAIGVSLVVLTNVRTNVPADVQTNVRPNVRTDVTTIVQSDVLPNDRLNARLNDRLNIRMNARPNDRPSDHERSLPSIEAVSALSVTSIASEPLSEDAPLTLKPLEIADLPLTADIFSPR